MPTIIDEGTLRFTFPDRWHAIKYDDTKFYRHKVETLGTELAAVDILSIPPDTHSNHLIMIEIKDFRGYAVINRKRQTSGELITEVMTKCMHTLSVLFAASFTKNVELYQFGEHPITPLGMHNPLTPRRIELILFMEEDVAPVANLLELHNQKTRITDMTMKLRRIHTNVNIYSRLLNTSSLALRDGFTVAHI